MGRKLGFEIQHVSEYIKRKLNMKPMKTINLKATFHNPCHLNRGLNAPEALKSILDSMPIHLIEMEEADRCCGAGGGVRAGERSLSMMMARRKAEFIIHSGAEACITHCPFCYIQIQDILKQLGYQQIRVYGQKCWLCAIQNEQLSFYAYAHALPVLVYTFKCFYRTFDHPIHDLLYKIIHGNASSIYLNNNIYLFHERLEIISEIIIMPIMSMTITPSTRNTLSKISFFSSS